MYYIQWKYLKKCEFCFMSQWTFFTKVHAETVHRFNEIINHLSIFNFSKDKIFTDVDL